MRTIIRLGLLLLAFAGAATARADEVGQAGQGVVRIITVVEDEYGNVEVWTGSGFAVSPTKIVTNSHVVEETYTATGRTAIGVVASNGRQQLEARVIGFDAEKDLALLQVDGARFQPLTLYGGPLREGAAITALGYPGNVDRLTGVPVIQPQAPMRTGGNYSNMRKAFGVEGLLHTAGIAHGNSGGPLVDACGRVVGVNTMVTGNDNGDTSFGFAIAFDELRAFLRRQGQEAAVLDSECVTAEVAERRAAEDKAKAELAEAKAQFERRLAAAEAERKSAGELQTMRENRLALAGLVLVLAVFAAAYALVAHGKSQKRPALVAAGLAVVFLAGAAALFLTRPTRAESASGAKGLGAVPDHSESGSTSPDQSSLPPASQAAAPAPGQALSCVVDEGRSRDFSAEAKPIELRISPTGCVNGRTQYAPGGNGAWLRVEVHKNEDVVQRLTVDPETGTLTVDKWLPDADTMAAARALKGGLASQTCTADAPARESLATVQRKVLGEMLRNPDERVVYRCTER